MGASEQVAVTKNELVQALTRSDHGKIEGYREPVQKGVRYEPEFLAHLMSWDHDKGSIRDAKRAIPVYALAEKTFPKDFEGNALACIASLDPREFVRAVREAKKVGVGGAGRSTKSLVERYIRFRESNWGLWERAFVAHRESMLDMYTWWHIKPGRDIFKFAIQDHKYPEGSTLRVIQQLPGMSPQEALGHTIQKKIPFKVLIGAMRDKMKDENTMLAMIRAMSPTEFVTHAKLLDKLGAKATPALRAAVSEKMAEIPRTPRGSAALFKTSKAATSTGGALGRDLHAMQERQLSTSASIEGDWAVFADKSSSMQMAIEASRHLSSTLTKLIKGKVHLVFFDQGARYMDVTGKTLEQLTDETRYVQAGGSTSFGAAMHYLFLNKIAVDAIAITSDGAENTMPQFSRVYAEYCKWLEKEVPVYLYWLPCYQPNLSNNNPDKFQQNMERAGFSIEVFDLREEFDHYSIPNIARTMRANRYSLADEIMNYPLKTLDGVFSAPRQELQT